MNNSPAKKPRRETESSWQTTPSKKETTAVATTSTPVEGLTKNGNTAAKLMSDVSCISSSDHENPRLVLHAGMGRITLQCNALNYHYFEKTCIELPLPLHGF